MRQLLMLMLVITAFMLMFSSFCFAGYNDYKTAYACLLVAICCLFESIAINK